MTIPTPPRLTGDPRSDTYFIGKYMGDIYRAIVAQLLRIANVPATGIANPTPSGTKVANLTPLVLDPFDDPPTAAEMEILRQQVNALTVATLKILQAAQLQ